MRLSCLRVEPGPFMNYETLIREGKVVRVLLDGVEQRDGILADDERGEIMVYVKDEWGNLLINHDEIQVEIKRGKVEIIIEDEKE